MAFVSAPPWKPIRARATSRRQSSLCTRCSVNDTPPAPPLPSFVPASAGAISDPAGVALLRSLSELSVSTSLRRAPIKTVHATCARAPDALPVVVLLHGFDSNSLEFRALLPQLCGRATVFAPDLLGWGLTEKPTDVAYGPAAKREHLRAYVACVAGGRRVTLVGASIGGAIAIDFALEHPHLVDGLVLVDAQAYQDRPRSGLLNALPVLASVGADVLRSTWLRRMALNMSYEDRAFCSEDALKMGALHVETDGWKAAAVDFILAEGYCVSGRVKEVEAPTLVLWGRGDRILPVENAQRFAEDIPGATVTIIDECGHSPHIEKAAIVAEYILDFLEKRVVSSDALEAKKSAVGLHSENREPFVT